MNKHDYYQKMMDEQNPYTLHEAIKNLSKYGDDPSFASQLITNPHLNESHLDKLIEHIKIQPDKNKYLFEELTNHPHLTNEQLHDIFEHTNDKYHPEETFHLNGNIISSQNYQKKPEDQELEIPELFWNKYERNANPEHFNKISQVFQNKSLDETPQNVLYNTNDPTTEDQRLAFKKYAKKTQNRVLNIHKKDIKIINNEPHILVHRGVGGNYAKQIKDLTKNQDHVNIPVSSLSSWTLDPVIAHRFSDTGNYNGEKHSIIISKYMPVSDIIHSGFHNLHPSHKHYNKYEQELVFKHDKPNLMVHKNEISILDNNDE